MGIEPLLEGRRCQANVFPLVVISLDGGLVHNRLCQACTVQWAMIFFATIAGFSAYGVILRCWLSFPHRGGIVLLDDSAMFGMQL